VRLEIIPVIEKFEMLEDGQVQQRRSKTDNGAAIHYEASHHVDLRYRIHVSLIAVTDSRNFNYFNRKIHPTVIRFTIIFLKSLNYVKVYYQSLLFTNECTSYCLKNNIKTYIKIASSCFGAVTPSSESALFVLAKFTLC